MGAPRAFTDEVEVEIAQEYKSGVGTTTLSRKHEVAPGTIRKALRRQGVQMRTAPQDRPHKGGRPKAFTEECEAEIAREYESGVGAPTLARKYGVSHKTIYLTLSRLGVDSRKSRPFNPEGFIVGGYRWLPVQESDRVGWPMTHPRGEKHYPYVMEHRLVVARDIDRPLYAHENVHHINGDRLDNRLENLELWSSSQPSGQRVSDKIAWAIEFLNEQGFAVKPMESAR